LKIRSRTLTRVLAFIAATLLRLLFRTCRIEIHSDAPETCPYEDTGDRRYLYCVWHNQIITTIFSGTPQKVAALVSRHQDGAYLADAMEMLGITPVRGSTNHGGDQAMRQLLEAVKDLHVTITPDGPRGPHHELKLGIVYLASRSGRGIVPSAQACCNGWRIPGSWTDMLLPKPFTTIYIRGGEPMHVPANLKRSELHDYQSRLQAEMDRLEVEVEALARGERPPAAAKQYRPAA
jgi:hypothetical protein